MTHFQLDDFEYYREIPTPNAVSPEPFLVADAKLFFDRIWSAAVFSTELVEPYATNPRDLRFPASRTWTRVSGDGPAGVRFTRAEARSPNYEYAILAESGTAVETGTVTLALTSRPFPGIDLTSLTGRFNPQVTLRSSGRGGTEAGAASTARFNSSGAISLTVASNRYPRFGTVST
jgi:hypothetical protein